MRAVLIVMALAATARAEPIRVTIECENEGRTKMCPAFLLGFVDAHKVLIEAPRSAADVIVYANAEEVALVDRVHLRFVSRLPHVPPVIETDADLDSRADDDTQRAQLEPAFLRGIALAVATRYPAAVKVDLTSPQVPVVVPPNVSPWDVALELGGYGNWTEKYQSANAWSTLSLARLERNDRIGGSLNASGGLNRQPPLISDTGMPISVNTKQWQVSADVLGAWLSDDTWSYGARTRGLKDDPKGQYRYSWTGKVGIEWDAYPADDPRGNRLAILYALGYQLDGYNLRNVLGETSAGYPIHELVVSGAVREDRVSFGLSLSLYSQLDHWGRRNNLSASPYVNWKLGGHIDVDFSVSITKRQIVEPDPSQIDPMDYEQLSRLSYAEPFAVNGSFNLNIHWDRTNGARNDRFNDL